MDANEIYLFHQTPNDLAIDLLKHIDFTIGDTVLEPFKGEGAFYNNLPTNLITIWSEIKEGRDWLTAPTDVDWVITNPPFRLEGADGKRENAFIKILNHYSVGVRKGIAFLINASCFAALTPNRLSVLETNGIYLHNIIVCSVKKWRGRYYFLIFKKQPSTVVKHLKFSY
jgi:hypothetical protein